LTITASNFLTNAQWLDPVGGLIISGMIIQAGWVNTKTALFELSDVSFDGEIKEKVHKAAALALKEDVGSAAEIKGVQGVKSGQNILVEVEVAVPGDWTISKTDQVESIVREKIGAKVRGVRRVVVRFGSDDNAAEPFAEDFIEKANGSEPEESDHEYKSNHSHDHQSNGRATALLPNTNGSPHKRR
jgi:divalent metal cation (Fe/Co/Zn/Cd) transporter